MFKMRLIIIVLFLWENTRGLNSFPSSCLALRELCLSHAPSYIQLGCKKKKHKCKKSLRNVCLLQGYGFAWRPSLWVSLGHWFLGFIRLPHISSAVTAKYVQRAALSIQLSSLMMGFSPAIVFKHITLVGSSVAELSQPHEKRLLLLEKNPTSWNVSIALGKNSPRYENCLCVNLFDTNVFIFNAIEQFTHWGSLSFILHSHSSKWRFS